MPIVETSCAVGAPQRMKKDILEVARFQKKTTNGIRCKNVPLKLYLGVWTNHCMLPHLLQGV